MSQNDFVINNDSFPATRADLTSAFQAAASNSSGATEPTTTYANMFWYDTDNNTLKILSEAKDAWISVGYLNQSTNEFSLFDDTKVVNSSGTQTALLGDQATASWEAGTSTTESLVSPDKVKAAIVANVPTSTLKAWGSFTATTGAILASDNVASINRTAQGSYVVTFTTGMGSSHYAVTTGFETSNADARYHVSVHSKNASLINLRSAFINQAVEPTTINFAVHAQ